MKRQRQLLRDNGHQDKTITTDLQRTSGTFTSKGEVSIISSDSLSASFTFDKKGEYVPVTKEIVKNGKLSYAFPPHSFTQIKIRLQKI
jgi:alpha-L-arabinofuranosidase